MKRFAAITLAALALFGCADKITIDPKEWTCIEWGEVTETVMTPTGRTAMPIDKTTLQCVEWRRVVRK